MEYELYIDIFFLENFMMDHILLLLVRRILKSPATLGNIALGALAGSVLMCVVTVLPLPCPIIKFFLFHGVVSVIMLRAGLRIPWGRKMVYALCLLYAAGFLAGGIMGYLSQYGDWMEVGSLFFALAAGSYYLASGVLWLLSAALGHGKYRCRAEIFWKERKVALTALIDTGNSLTDPFTGEPVSILERTAADELFCGQMPEQMRYIPYRSVGRKEGVLPAVRLEKLCIYERGPRWIEAPLVGISEDAVSSDGTYRMLIHPDL